MKKLLFLAVIFLAAPCFASDPVDIVTVPKGDYTIAYSTVAFSSATVNCVPADSTNAWREIYMVHPSSGSTIFYEANSTTPSTTTLANVGFPFTANLGRMLQSNKQICGIVPAGEAALTMRVEIWRRR